VSRLLRIETCAECPHCHYSKVNAEFTCQHPLHLGDVYVLDSVDADYDFCIDVTQEISDDCPLEEAT
jgi:hypothetical protein